MAVTPFVRNEPLVTTAFTPRESRLGVFVSTQSRKAAKPQSRKAAENNAF